MAPWSRSTPGEIYFNLSPECSQHWTFDRQRVWILNLVCACLQLGGRIPVLDSLSELVLRAEGIPVRLDPLSRLEALISDVQAWKESAAKTFLLKNSPFSLLEVNGYYYLCSFQSCFPNMSGAINNVCLCFQVLCPRCDVGTGHQKSRSKKAKETTQISKKSSTKLESLCDVERALSESKDSASAVSVAVLLYFFTQQQVL